LNAAGVADASGSAACVLTDAVGVDPENLYFDMAHVAENAAKDAVPNFWGAEIVARPVFDAVPSGCRTLILRSLPGIGQRKIILLAEGVNRRAAQLHSVRPETLKAADEREKLDMLLLIALASYVDELRNDGCSVVYDEFMKRLPLVVVIITICPFDTRPAAHS
jgi:hypothetical protein